MWCNDDFGPLIANPKTLLLAAAQIGVFAALVSNDAWLYSSRSAAIIVIVGADGPTSIT
ncbi:MAG: sodium ion-translocating decarboxylase subunit beta [Veillonella sp.]